MASEYIIETVNDFLKVPEDKIDLCLSEFKEALNISRLMMEIAAIGYECTHGEKPQSPLAMMPYFKWIDDGEKNITITIGTQKDTP